jgi:hypothetical protein
MALQGVPYIYDISRLRSEEILPQHEKWEGVNYEM